MSDDEDYDDSENRRDLEKARMADTPDRDPRSRTAEASQAEASKDADGQ